MDHTSINLTQYRGVSMATFWFFIVARVVVGTFLSRKSDKIARNVQRRHKFFLRW